jgi:hypothetical protein
MTNETENFVKNLNALAARAAANGGNATAIEYLEMARGCFEAPLNAPGMSAAIAAENRRKAGIFLQRADETLTRRGL